MTTGVLALQGAFALHQSRLESLGEQVVQVRAPADLQGVERLVIPGGESTTVSMLAERFDLLGPLTEFAQSGKAVLGTCAGAILLSAEIQDGRADQHCLGAIDISTRRNGFGRQVDSFEQDVQIPVLGDPPFHAVCIRAPVISRVGESVTVLATIDSRPALVRSGAIIVSIFHPELVEDLRLHHLFLSL
ncbi:unannotated protein [freshwater metagenome]|uniref:glutaminase n=1 Tax=freshwater metagenome TaxID=449393 RepID=A0A6J6RWV6_9ZZZZ|nr:pyridoxal 5'-phosphate synthase glutaminase subunit PdxT [Actinomycetota bacterium]MSY78057.1 pyridoxal 5'-phosphate synthase glutaminase subunit PdxT [Actinomycetota bacterium]